MAHVCQSCQSDNQDHKQSDNPAGSARVLIVVGLLRTRHIRRNTHPSASSDGVMTMNSDQELSPAARFVSISMADALADSGFNAGSQLPLSLARRSGQRAKIVVF